MTPSSRASEAPQGQDVERGAPGTGPGAPCGGAAYRPWTATGKQPVRAEGERQRKATERPCEPRERWVLALLRSRSERSRSVGRLTHSLSTECGCGCGRHARTGVGTAGERRRAPVDDGGRRSSRAQVSEAVWLSTFQDARALQLDGDHAHARACPAPRSGSGSRVATSPLVQRRARTRVGSPELTVAVRGPRGAVTTRSTTAQLRRPLQRRRPRRRRPRPATSEPRPATGRRRPEQQVHLRDLREGHLEPVRARRAPCASPRRRPGPTTRCSSTAPPASARPTCSTPSATTSTRTTPTTPSATSPPRHFLNEYVDAIRTELHGASSSAATARSTSCSSTTSSSWRARRGSRRSSSTPSTPSTGPTSRSSSPPTARPTPSRRSRTASGAGSSGASSPTSSRPTSRPASPSCATRPSATTAACHADVLEFIATHITNNIRELEGALIRVSAYASLNQVPVTVELAERLLADILGDEQPRRSPPTASSRPPPSFFGFTVEALKGKSRQRPLVTARQIGMYVLPRAHRPVATRPSPGSSAAATTPRSSTPSRRSRKLMKERQQVYDQVTELTQRFKAGLVSPRRSRSGDEPVGNRRGTRWTARTMSTGHHSGPPRPCARLWTTVATSPAGPDLQREPVLPNPQALSPLPASLTQPTRGSDPT